MSFRNNTDCILSMPPEENGVDTESSTATSAPRHDMSKPEREFISIRLRMSLWAHRIVMQRKEITGRQEWRIVEDLMEAGLEAETKIHELTEALERYAAGPASPKEHANLDPETAYYWAAAAIKNFFEDEPSEFMRTISRLRGDKKALTINDWKKWEKDKHAPLGYLPEIRTLMIVMSGLMGSLQKSRLKKALREK